MSAYDKVIVFAILTVSLVISLIPNLIAIAMLINNDWTFELVKWICL